MSTKPLPKELRWFWEDSLLKLVIRHFERRPLAALAWLRNAVFIWPTTDIGASGRKFKVLSLKIALN